MSDRTTALDILEAIYSMDPASDDRAWLEGLREAARGALSHSGLLIYRYCVASGRVRLPIVLGDAGPDIVPPPRDDLERLHAAGAQAGRMNELYARPALRRESGVAEVFGVLAPTHATEGHFLGFCLSAAQLARITDWPRVRRIWTGLSHHISRAARLRLHLADAGRPIADLAGSATAGPPAPQEAAPVPAVRDSEAPADRWEALLAGRWSIVQTRARGGQLRFVAIENPSAGAPLRTLSSRERRVIEEVARGRSNKAIAIDLGVCEAAVATILGRSLRKLGLARREHLPRLAAAFEADARRARRSA